MLCQSNTEAALDWRATTVIDRDGQTDWGETYGARMFMGPEVTEDSVALSLRRAHALRARGFGVHLTAWVR